MKGLLILILFTVALVGGCVLSSPQFPEEYSLDDVEIKYTGMEPHSSFITAI